jgi:hypothetical protein
MEKYIAISTDIKITSDKLYIVEDSKTESYV